ncbi:MAG: succinylglutamate desuccinylase/aspartoacylase family protein [Gammaproteobacteria bacterium]|nr:succinylglutamate desuccinylase/aspartoacylase family protein [Gammaproteobacteria bacterium]MCP5136760.1 succinylglutamate desuccinylase/aspartoacylase family protein [Gammaproteobacteria bacterium]
MPRRTGFSINGTNIAAGSRALISLELAQQFTGAPMSLPVHVVHGREAGPTLFVSAAIHGDELNGIEIIRRLLKQRSLRGLRGTLLAVPMVNMYGVLDHSRYLPDRRDLNRSFPGSDSGSMAARLANTFMTEIVARCTYGIDLHTGAIGRANLPQIRANLDDPETERLARSFGVPVLINSSLRDGSLREAAAEAGVSMLLYEAGEALRLDELSIRAGVSGVIGVMRVIGMLPPGRRRKAGAEPFVARSSQWVRAPESGMCLPQVALGARVSKGQVLALIADPVTGREDPVEASASGVIIGRSHQPLVHEGEALFHVGRFEASKRVAAEIENFQSELQPAPGQPFEPLPIV